MDASYVGRFEKCAVVYMLHIKREGRVVCATCRQRMRIVCIILMNKEGMVCRYINMRGACGT